MTPPTTEELLVIRRRCEAATAGPWNVCRDATGATQEIMCIAHPRPDLAEKYPADDYGEMFRRDQICLGHCVSEGDAAFIAAARTDVPKLLDEIERLRAARDEAE